MPSPLQRVVSLVVVLVLPALVQAVLPAVASAAPRLDTKPHGEDTSPAAPGYGPQDGTSPAAPGRGPHQDDTSPASPGRDPRKRHARANKGAKLRGCLKAPVEVAAGGESATFALAKCDGTASVVGLDRLSSLARAPSGHRLDAELVEKLELAVDHFRRAGGSARIVLVSGYRPRSGGTYHSSGRALDFRIEGVDDEALVAFCKTLPDTGCGYYPNSAFVHMDVRPPGTGHVAWTDRSRPGEAPRYVTKDSERSMLPAPPDTRHEAQDAEPKSDSDTRAHSI